MHLFAIRSFYFYFLLICVHLVNTHLVNSQHLILLHLCKHKIGASLDKNMFFFFFFVFICTKPERTYKTEYFINKEYKQLIS